MSYDPGLKKAADLVRSIATQAMVRFQEGYEVKLFDSEFFPIYVFYRDGQFIGAVRQCGEVAGVSANVGNLSDPLGTFLYELLSANDVPIYTKGKNAVSYEKGDMYSGRQYRVGSPVQPHTSRFDFTNPVLPLTKIVNLLLQIYSSPKLYQ